MVSFDVNVFIELFLIIVNAFMFVYGLGKKLKMRKSDVLIILSLIHFTISFYEFYLFFFFF